MRHFIISVFSPPEWNNQSDCWRVGGWMLFTSAWVRVCGLPLMSDDMTRKAANKQIKEKVMNWWWLMAETCLGWTLFFKKRKRIVFPFNFIVFSFVFYPHPKSNYILEVEHSSAFRMIHQRRWLHTVAFTGGRICPILFILLQCFIRVDFYENIFTDQNLAVYQPIKTTGLGAVCWLAGIWHKY